MSAKSDRGRYSLATETGPADDALSLEELVN